MVTEFALEILLKIIKLARSTYYYHLKQLDQNDKDYDVKVEIQAIFTEHKGNYGYRRMTLELRNRGFVVNILRLVVRKSPTGESTHYFFRYVKVEVSC